MNEDQDDNTIHLAGCVITDDYGRMLLLHRASDPGQWELPGGKVEPGETPELAAMRELAEELGVSVHLRRKLASEPFEQDEQQYMYHWFEAEVIGGEPEILEPENFDDLEYFEIEDLVSLALSANMQVMSHKLYSGELTFGD